MGFFREWGEQLRGYNSNVKRFLWTHLLFQVGMGMFMIMYNLYVVALGHDQILVGQIISAKSLAMAIILVPAGILSDRLGRKKVILIGLIFTIMSFVFRSLLEGAHGLLITAFMTGLFASFIQVSAVPYLAEHSTKKQRVHLLSLNFSIMMIGQVLGNIGGGAFADIVQVVLGLSELQSLRMTLLLGTFVTIIAFIPALRLQEKPRPKQVERSTTPGIQQFKALVIENRSALKVIGLFAGAQLLIGFGAGLVIPYMNLYFADRFAASNSAIGFVVSLGQAATALAILIGPALVKRVGEVRAVVILQLTSIPFLLITGLTNIFILAAIAFLLRQALMNAGNPIQMSLMMSKVGDNMKGLANSIFQMIFQLGWALMGPVSAAIVSAHGSYWGYAYVFMITSGLYLLGSIYFYFVFRSKNEEAHTTPSL